MKQKRQDRGQKREKQREIGEKAGRREKRLRSDRHICPRRENMRWNRERRSSYSPTE
jgi:hypothetical protein